MIDIVTAYTGRIRYIIDCAHCGARVERYVFPGQEVRFCSPRCGQLARNKARRRRRKDEARWEHDARSREQVEGIEVWIDALRSQMAALGVRSSIARCKASNKVTFVSMERAWVVAFRGYSTESLNAYRCGECEGFHLGNSRAPNARQARARAKASFEAASLLI